MTDNNKIHPVNRSEFGLADHRFNRFDATVDSSLTQKDITSPALWVNLAPRVKPSDEIRVRAEDDSWVALLHVTYSSGNQLLSKVVYHAKLESVDHTATNILGDYEIKLRGTKKWCIVQLSTGEVKQDLIPTQAKAYKEMEDYIRALAA